MNIARRLLFPILALAFAFPAGAGERIDQRLEAQTDGTVSIDNLAGSVTVSVWDRNEVRVEGEIDPRAERLEFENEGNFTRIKVVYPRRTRGNVRGSELNVSVPAGSRLEVDTVSAEVDMRGVRGAVRVDTVSGNVSTDGASNDYALESVSGNIRLEGTRDNARVQAETVSGDLRLDGVKGELDAGSVSGNIHVAGATLSRAEVENTSGDISLTAQFAAEGVFRFESISGDVTLEFAAEPSGVFDIATFSGDIDNGFGPEPQRTGKWSPGMELKFSAGGGEAEFRINTLSGDVSLRKR